MAKASKKATWSPKINDPRQIDLLDLISAQDIALFGGYKRPGAVAAGERQPAFEVVDLCSGIGASAEALRQAKIQARYLGYCEIAPAPLAVLRARHPDALDLGDLTSPGVAERAIAGRAPGLPLVVCAGFPCQSFSLNNGNRRSLGDPRGRVAMAGMALVDRLQPDAFVGENVAGLLLTKDNAFGALLAALCGASEPVPAPLTKGALHKFPAAGFAIGPCRLVAWRKLDAAAWGVPQHRDRVWIVAIPVGGGNPATLFDRPFGHTGEMSLGEPNIDTGEVRVWLCDQQGGIGGLHAGRGPIVKDNPNFRGLALADVLDTDWEEGTTPTTAFTFAYSSHVRASKPLHPNLLAAAAEIVRANAEVVRASLKNFPDATQRMDYLNHFLTIYPSVDPAAVVAFTGDATPKWNDRHAHTLCRSKGGAGAGVVYAKPGLVMRKFTAAEAARLQGLPDDHCLVPGRSGALLSANQIRQCLGNSMAVPCLKRALLAAAHAIQPPAALPAKCGPFAQAAIHLGWYQSIAQTPHRHRLEFERIVSRLR